MEQSQHLPVIRRRVNWSYSVRGILTTDSTFEVISDRANGWVDPYSSNPNIIEFQPECEAFFKWVNETWPPPPLEIKGG